MEDNCNRQDRKENVKKAENPPNFLYLYRTSRMPLSHKLYMNVTSRDYFTPVTSRDYFNLEPV